MEREPIKSSTLLSAGFDPANGVLELEFTSGAVYEYFDVPDIVFVELMAAVSKGRYYNACIKDLFPYSRV